MTVLTRPARFLVLLAVALLGPLTLVPPRYAMGQAKPSSREGIDLVLLVDVSGSMSTVPGRPRGNDPEHIRWDAVLLSINLLTAEDRVVILPFNGDVPAKYPGNQGVFVPGRMPESFFESRSEGAEKIRKKVRDFALSNNNNPIVGDEWNGDAGNTSILLAVDRARDIFKREPDSKDRHRFVILLTDGEESAGSAKPKGLGSLQTPGSSQSLSGLEKNGYVKQWLEGVRVDLAKAHAKIYTIGLGENSDLPLLAFIARLTSGYNQYVADNAALIDTFRNLIWQLKGSWTKSFELAPSKDPRTEDDLMSDIRDIGILSYKNVPNLRPRVDRALGLGEEFKFSWTDRAGNPLNLDAQVFNAAAESHTYVHYDHANFPGGSSAADRLQTSWDGANVSREIHFSKRTPSPLFAIVPFKEGIGRYNLLPVRVNMETNLGFQPDDFELDAMLQRSAGPDQPARDLFANRVPLAWRDGQFAADLDLSGLEPPAGNFDDCTLIVTARGKPLERNFSLRGYTLTLPPIALRVDTRLTLKNPGLVPFSNEVQLQQPPIKIRPAGTAARAVPGSKPMAFQVELQASPVDEKKRPLLLAKFSTVVRLAANSIGELEGDLDVELPLIVPIGLYTGGKLKVSSVDPLYPKLTAPLIIPFQVSITTLKVRLNRNSIPPLVYKEGPAVASEVIKFTVPGNAFPPTSGNVKPRLTVMIPETAEMGGFGPGELWLEKARGTTAPTARSQKLEVNPLEESFQVFFQPKPSHETGFYSFRLNVTGMPDVYEFDSSYGGVKLNFQAPEILPPLAETIRLQRGSTVVYEIKFGLRGAPTVSREVGFRCFNPKAQAVEPPAFRWEGQAESQSAISLEPLDTLKLTASPVATPAVLRVKIEASPEMKCGRYELQYGQLWANRTEPQPVGLAIEVNDLEVLDLDGLRTQRELSFLQLKGKPLVRTFQVFAEKGELQPGQVDVVGEGPFVNESNNTESPGLQSRTLAKETCKHPKDGRAGVRLSLSFPDPDVSFEQYSGRLAIRCADLGLTKSIGCRVERVELLRPKKEPAPK